MRVTVVTSCSKEGYKAYGYRFIKSFDLFWPKDIDLYIVSEDASDIPEFTSQHRNIHKLNLYQVSRYASEFHEQHVDNLEAHGKGADARDPKHNRHWRTGYNFRKDAYKFSKKVFAIGAVAERVVNGRLIWLDADVFTFDNVPLDIFKQFPPDSYCLAYLDRGEYHSECGVVAYNLDCPETHQFITRFVELYHSGEVFQLKEWHDSWIFDWLRYQTNIRSWQIPYKGVSKAPFDNSELGKYMMHLKGSRKTLAGVRGISAIAAYRVRQIDNLIKQSRLDNLDKIKG